MRVWKDVTTVYDFEFWSGGKDTVEDLTCNEVETIISILEDCYPEGMSATELNDFFWFERDTIAEWLGYSSFEEIMCREDEE